MRCFSAEAFAKLWSEGKIKWHTNEAIDLPLPFQCPYCSHPIVLAHRVDDEQKQFIMIMGHFALFIPNDMSKKQLQEMWNKLIRPSFFHWLEDREKANETPSQVSQPEDGGAIPPLATQTKES